MKKKLNLKALESSAKEILSREQLKKITGGDDGSCGYDEHLYRCTNGAHGVHYFCGVNADVAANKYFGQLCSTTPCGNVYCTL